LVVNENVLDSVEQGVEIVLVLARIELTFFIIAGMVLCFGFLTKTVLIRRGCFSCR